jgi:uncharacterized protein YjbI with pentapeptide repeats
VISGREEGLMAASKNAFWHPSRLKFLPKKKKTSPSARKIRYQIIITLFITTFLAVVVAILEDSLKNENPEPAIKPELNTKNPQIIEFFEAYNQNEARQEENKKCRYRTITLGNNKIDLTGIICPLADSKLLGQVQNIGVLSAAILFLLDTRDRKKQLERQAWQLIDGAQGSETSGARRQAIEELYEEGADITGLDADGADLRGINLSGANCNLTRASFKNAILDEANFEGANLKEANFTGAKLRGANFKGACLWGANFTRADLRAFSDDKKTDFRDADLGLTIFKRAKLSEAIFGRIDSEPYLGNETNLKGAILRGAKLKDVNLNKVYIAGAKFGGAIIEDIETISNALQYEEAFYDKDFYEAHKDKIKYVDEKYYEDPEFQQITTQQIVEISQRLLSKQSLSLQDEESLSDFINLLNHLVILVKESNNECLSDNELSDKVIDVKKALESKRETEQDALIKISDNKKLIQETKEMLAEKRKKRNME